jgi:hypothetical protein
MRRVNQLAVLIIGVALVAAGCSDPPDGTRSGDATAYAAAVRAVLVDAIGLDLIDGRPIYIVRGIRPGAAEQPRPPAEPLFDLWPEARDTLTTALSDIGPVEFIDDPQDVLVSNGCTHVVNDGMRIIVGPIEPTDDGYRIGVGEFTNCLGASGTIVHLDETDEGWVVTRLEGTFIS